MANVKININQSVAILCDGNNIERSLHEKVGKTGAMLNFDIMIPKLLNGRGLKRLIYFKEGRNISDKLAGRLHENYYGSVVPCHKSADIPLSIKATQLASKVDTIIILSGDSDYVDLVTHLKSEGVRVEIAAVRKNAARILLESADYFHEIKEGDFFVYNGRPNYHNRQRRPVQQKNASAQPNQVLNQTTSYTLPDLNKSSSNVSVLSPVSETVKNPVKVAVDARKITTKPGVKEVTKDAKKTTKKTTVIGTSKKPTTTTKPRKTEKTSGAKTAEEKTVKKTKTVESEKSESKSKSKKKGLLSRLLKN